MEDLMDVRTLCTATTASAAETYWQTNDGRLPSNRAERGLVMMAACRSMPRERARHLGANGSISEIGWLLGYVLELGNGIRANAAEIARAFTQGIEKFLLWHPTVDAMRGWLLQADGPEDDELPFARLRDRAFAMVSGPSEEAVAAARRAVGSARRAPRTKKDHLVPRINALSTGLHAEWDDLLEQVAEDQGVADAYARALLASAELGIPGEDGLRERTNWSPATVAVKAESTLHARRRSGYDQSPRSFTSGRGGEYRPEQAIFARGVKRRSQFRCIITGHTTPLDAAHLKARLLGGPGHPDNGIALIRKVHQSMDALEWTLDEEFRIVATADAHPAVRELHGQRPPFLGDDQGGWPGKEWVTWHRQEFARRHRV